MGTNRPKCPRWPGSPSQIVGYLVKDNEAIAKEWKFFSFPDTNVVGFLPFLLFPLILMPGTAQLIWSG
jgi:hypothetical protein